MQKRRISRFKPNSNKHIKRNKAAKKIQRAWKKRPIKRKPKKWVRKTRRLPIRRTRATGGKGGRVYNSNNEEIKFARSAARGGFNFHDFKGASLSNAQKAKELRFLKIAAARGEFDSPYSQGWLTRRNQATNQIQNMWLTNMANNAQRRKDADTFKQRNQAASKIQTIFKKNRFVPRHKYLPGSYYKDKNVDRTPSMPWADNKIGSRHVNPQNYNFDSPFGKATQDTAICIAKGSKHNGPSNPLPTIQSDGTENNIIPYAHYPPNIRRRTYSSMDMSDRGEEKTEVQ